MTAEELRLMKNLLEFTQFLEKKDFGIFRNEYEIDAVYKVELNPEEVAGEIWNFLLYKREQVETK